MKFSISRDALLKPLNLVAGVVERRQTLRTARKETENALTEDYAKR